MTTPSPSQNRSRRYDLAALLVLIGILLVGGVFRFYNVNWDEGTYHIHPDERHTTMVVTSIQWPASLVDYFDTSRSPLNPRNVDKVFFYGTLPLFLTKSVATVVGRTGYDEIHLVGRVLSGLFDLGTVLLLYFLARRLFDWRVGLIASLLLALTALNIQGSHYFAVDTFLALFVMLTIWFTIDVAEGKGWLSFLGLGLSMGLTLASKVSVFLLAAVVVVGVWIRVRRLVAQGHDPSKTSLRAVLGLAFAAIVSLAVFRVAQPYAWAGPNYTRWDTVPDPWGEKLRVLEVIPEPVRGVVMPNPQWIADIVSAGAQQTGEADLPWGRQWTERTPWLYPLENMVLWGMGVPLGIAAWAGVVLLIIQLVRSWRRAKNGPAHKAFDSKTAEATSTLRLSSLVILPLTWVLLTFFWQGMQYVKSIRYFLPIYPYLVMFAAYLVVTAWDWARGRRWAAKFAAGALAAFVLLGTLAWALAFIQIFREPVTRVQATHWMYGNIESGATLHYDTAEGETGQLQLSLPAEYTYVANGQWYPVSFVAPEDLVATSLVMNHLAAPDGPKQAEFEIAITHEQYSGAPLAEAQLQATFDPEGDAYVLGVPDLPLGAGEQYFFQSRVVSGAPLVSRGAAIANEHFDDPLPFNMDGRIAFGTGLYRGLDLTLYDEDTPQKLEELLDVLDEADYISMSSGRLHTSIPRLPMRYPVTTRYYELLFAEELGFEKATEFHSYPRLFGIEFNDDRAEEQFTVYDHPKVLLYRKTDDYDRARVRSMLTEGIDWDEIAYWLNPRDVREWRREQERAQSGNLQEEGILEGKNELKLTEPQKQAQERAGTWASIFDRNSLVNRWPTLSWYLLVALVGLAALPLTVGIFRRLPDRGYILARLVGALLLAWLAWILTSLTPLHYDRRTILFALALVAAGSLATLLLHGQRRRLAEMWRTQKRHIIVSELLFLAFFLLAWLMRWGNPDLWHAWKGGEKPMDFAYLNAVIKSIEFPPYDPWFAGGYLNYYYFGQAMVATLIKLAGLVPAVAYNLAIPSWFAMTAMGAFSVTSNLVKGVLGTGSRRSVRPYLFGLVGALFVMVLGNLGEVYLLLGSLGDGVLENFRSTIPGLVPLVRVGVGFFDVVFGGRTLSVGLDEWYWNASRVIPAGPYEAVITEFPFFTFLYGDLHAHLIAMPLTFLSLAAALAVVVPSERSGAAGGRGLRGALFALPLLLLWSLTIGAMRTTNTWDVPPHLLIVLGALAIGEFSRRGCWSWRAVWSVVWQFGLVFVLSWWLLYAPFWAHYGSFYNRLGIWSGTRTPIWAYLMFHGLFLFTIVSYLLVRVLGREGDPLLRRLRLTVRFRGRANRLRKAAGIVRVGGLPVSAWVWIAVGALILLELFLLVPGLVGFTRAGEGVLDPEAHTYRGLAAFALGLPVAIMGLLVLFRPRLSAAERLWAYLVLLGLAMSLGVEVIVLQGDIGRMNTVFKFYLQVWLLWGVAAAAALAWVIPRVRQWSYGRILWFGALGVLLFSAALYPPLATSARLRDRFDAELGGSLDGWDYMETAHYLDPNGQSYDLRWDLEAIRWLLDNVVGTPVILEGHTPEYRWGARYSINTGLPTVLGWNWHQRQQRAAANDQEVWQRADDVATIYNETLVPLILPLLEKYRVRYLVVGPLERAYYDPVGLQKFPSMVEGGLLQVVFQNEEVTIYLVVE